MKNMKSNTNKIAEISMRESLAMMREMQTSQNLNFKRVTQQSVSAIQLLHEDFSGSNNQEFQEDQQAIVAALNVSVTITNRDDNGQRVEMSGTIKFNSEAKFIFTTERNDGIYLSTDTLQLDEEVLQSIMKLRAYYEQWYETNIQNLNGGDNGGANGAGSGEPVTI